jgi:hypothetical protein
VIRSVERADPEEQWTTLCFIAGRSVTLPAEEANAAVRRAELLLAAGGDPRRRLELYGRAVTALAGDLDTAGRRRELAEGLAALDADVTGLRGASESLRILLGDPGLAWQCFAASVLADELTEP